MNTFARKWVGWGILGMSLLIGLFLHLSGVPLLSLVSSRATTFPNGDMATVAALQMRWPLIVLFIIGSFGLFFLLLPLKKRIPPIIRSKPKV